MHTDRPQSAAQVERGGEGLNSAPEPRRLVQRVAPWLLALSVVLLGASQLDQYSVTWDEALGDMFFGERYLSFFTTFDPRYLDFAADPYPAGRSPDLSSSPFRDRPWEYYPLVNMLGAACVALFHRALGWFDPFDAFHLANLLLAAVFVVVLYRFVESRRDAACALFSVGLLFTAPRLVVHLLANTKDFPELVLFSIALLAFVLALERGSVPWLLGAGMLTGLALATKANALFLAPIYLLALLACRAWRRFDSLGALALGGAGAALAALLVVYASWPYLWPAPLERAAEHLAYISGQVNQVREESLLSPLGALLYTTPLPFLGLALVGLFPTIKRARSGDPLACVALSWIGVTVGRLYLPGAVNFDGVRHFLEIYPALVLLAVDGTMSFVQFLDQRVGAQVRGGARTLWPIVAGLALLANLAPTVRLHPHQIAYWNVLVGGTDGAFERDLPQAGDYWGLSYRQGVRWLNENAPPDSMLGVPLVEHAVRLVAPERLRADIGLLRLSLPNTPRVPPDFVPRLLDLARSEAPRPLYVMFTRRDDWSNAIIEYCQQNLEPVHQIRVDGAVILEIYRLPATG